MLTHLILLFLQTTLILATPCQLHPPFQHIHLITLIPTTLPQLTALITLLSTSPCPPQSLSPVPLTLNTPQTLLLTSHQYLNLPPHFPPTTLRTKNLAAYIATLPRQRTGYIRKPFLIQRQNVPPPLDQSFYSQYSTHEDLLAKWQSLVRDYPTHVRLVSIATSIHNRTVYALRIGTTDPQNPKRLFLNGLQHAREWVAAHVVTYIAEHLAVALATNIHPLADLLRSVEVILVPLVNPDGYVYSHTTHRLQRKNRRKAGCPAPNSDGVDLNRNWGMDFAGKSNNTDPCSQDYAGTSAFSEPETAGMRDFIRGLPGIKAHVDFHSFGQLVLGAWSHSLDDAPRATESRAVGEAVTQAMSTAEGKQYMYGPGAKTLYTASGTMSDWTMSEGIMSFTIELRPEQNSDALLPFELSEAEIEPTCVEGAGAVKVLMMYCNNSVSFLEQHQVIPTAEPGPGSNNVTKEDGEGGLDVPFIAGISAAGVLLVVVIGLIILVMRRDRRVLATKRKARSLECDRRASPDVGSNAEQGPEDC